MAKAAVNRQQQAQEYAAVKRERKNLELQVEDLELKARYWKAQFEIRSYTLQAEELQEPYDEYMKIVAQKNKELQERFEEQLKALKDKGAAVVVEDGPVQ